MGRLQHSEPTDGNQRTRRAGNLFFDFLSLVRGLLRTGPDLVFGFAYSFGSGPIRGARQSAQNGWRIRADLGFFGEPSGRPGPHRRVGLGVAVLGRHGLHAIREPEARQK